MSATNSTPIINLPLFIGTDKPSWLVDWNGAMNTIDTAIANLQTAESGTATSLASLAQSVEALSGTVSQHTTAIQTVTTATSGNTASINTINSLIGNGEPTTTDKTIIGAINEVNAKIPAGGAVKADDVVYDNTQSGLTATNVQAAIDEVNAKIPAGATFGTYVDLTTYSNANMYTAPSDGYCYAYCTAGNSTSRVIINNALAVSAPDDTVYSSCFIRKGMTLFGYVTGSGIARFYPFA